MVLKKLTSSLLDILSHFVGICYLPYLVQTITNMLVLVLLVGIIINITIAKEIEFEKPPEVAIRFRNGGFEASAANAVVNCGNHTAARCENCKGGRKGCFEEGDCRWNYLTYTCVNKECSDDSPHCSYWQKNWGCNNASVSTYCKKTCVLCDGQTDVLKCKNTAAWCEAAQPNCNTEIAREKCKKYCGICESDACGSRKCSNNQKCCKFQTCEDLNSRDIPDPQTWTCQEVCPMELAFCPDIPEGSGERATPPPAINPAQAQFLRISKIRVEVGRDGTDANAAIKICSDVNINRCCTADLSERPNNGFDHIIKNKQIQNWDVKDLGGSCQTEEFQVLNVPRISITTVKADNIEIRLMNLVMKNNAQEEIRFSCEHTELIGDCTGQGCTFTYDGCKNY